MNNTEKYFLLRFGRQLATMRKERCLTRKELAKLVGISSAYIASIESGRHWPRLVVHHALDKFLDKLDEKARADGYPAGLICKMKESPEMMDILARMVGAELQAIKEASGS